MTTPRAKALCEAVRLSEAITTDLRLALGEERNREITAEQKANSIGVLTRRALRLSALLSQRLSGIP